MQAEISVDSRRLYGLPALGHGQIRLLRVCGDAEANEIRCSVSVRNLSDVPDDLVFSALSYTWDPCYQGNCELKRPRAANTITCNDEPVTVTDNLHDFLWYWATNQPNSTYLWTDALCIDQKNLREQSYQVNIMGKIYSTASQVYIWLGSEDESTPLAFDMLNRLSLIGPNEKAALHPQEVSTKNTNPLLDLTRWRALTQFFSRTWFSRAWIIQEAIFAKTSTVICGSQTTSWDTVAKVSRFLATTIWTNFLQDPTVFENNGERSHNTPARLAAQLETWKGSHKDGLLYALIRARPFNCHDPKDKVYSQIHLGRANIFPDYKRTEVEVFTVTAEYILGQSPSMLLLTCVEGEEYQNPAFDLPSWVPDWSATAFTGLRITGYRHYHAAGTRPSKYYISPNSRVLTIEALRLDEIIETCEEKKALRAHLQSSNLWQLISRLTSTYTNAQGMKSREEVVWRTLMTNRGSTDTDPKVRYPAPAAIGLSFRDWILWRYAVMPKESTKFLLPSTNNGMLPTQDELKETRERAEKDPMYLTALARRASLFDLHYSHAMLQRPYRTKQGYFGIGTQCLREGDSVWLVSGCRVPLILRRVQDSDRYRLVGGSYLHGFMDGEALDREGEEFEMVSLE